MSSSSSSSSSLSELESLRQRVAELEARLHSIERNAEQKKRTTIETISGEVVDSNPYSRLMALKAMGIVKDYARIRDVSVLIVGVGGVGSVAAEMLTRCGVGKLILFDYDKVELANMNRLFFRPEHCGLMKVDAARLTLREINPDVKIDTYHYNITSVDHFDHFLTTIKTGGIKEGTPITLLLCCVDNYEARISINSAMNELDQVWMESGVSEDAVAGHIQLCLPGRTACFECTPPLIVATGGNERSLKREGVCAASLPTTMGLVAALLVQNVLKYTLEFGELTYYLGYNSLKDYFPTWPMNPNPHCNNNHCRKLQQKYKGWKTREELEAERLAAEKANQQEESFDNEWGITIDESSEDKDNEKLTKAGLSTEFTAATNTTIAAEDIAPSADGEDLNDLLAQLKSAQLGK